MQTSTLPQRDDRRLLAEISAWAHASGWTQSWRGWQNAATDDQATVVVGHDDGGLRVWRKDARGMFPLRSTDYPADSLREAVDILAAIRVLPVVFSSAYRTGRKDGHWIAVGWDTEDGAR